MMLTREEAEATWCPMVRIARLEEVPGIISAEGMTVVGGCNSDALSRNRVRVPASCRCIADKCAMWRWGEYRMGELAGKVIDEPALGPGGKRMHFTANKVPHRGYCGLAGAPVIFGGAA